MMQMKIGEFLGLKLTARRHPLKEPMVGRISYKRGIDLQAEGPQVIS
jgi:hypothetical protein